MAAPSDPLFASQWRLSNASGVDLNVLPVWDPVSGAAYTGAGVSVLIFDDAVEIDPLSGHVHSDLDDNYARDGGGNFLHLTIGGVTYAPTPIDRGSTSVSDTHGTQVAGILAAERNGEGGVGVAYDVTFTVAPILRSDTPAPLVGAASAPSTSPRPATTARTVPTPTTTASKTRGSPSPSPPPTKPARSPPTAVREPTSW